MGEFNPQRLRIARERRAMTKVALATEVDITARSVTDYERGAAAPGDRTLARIVKCLGFPEGFFYEDDLEVPDLGGVSFRALSRMSAKARGQALSVGAVALSLSKWIDERFQLPPPSLPRIDEPGIDPELAADSVRRLWGLGELPIDNMIRLLEMHGARVFSLPQECEEVDAYSFWQDSTPYVFLNTRKTAERSRFDAAHELGHLVLHSHGIERGKKTESEAQAFASAFLMPRASVLAKAPRGGVLPQLIQAKRVWAVSLAALTYRMRELELLTEWQFRTLYVQLSKLGYRTDEPFGISAESSTVLQRVFELLGEDGKSFEDVAHAISIGSDELNEIVFGLIPHRASMRVMPGGAP